jgi:cytochrome bd-type quinol oxidase subunit 2
VPLLTPSLPMLLVKPASLFLSNIICTQLRTYGWVICCYSYQCMCASSTTAAARHPCVLTPQLTVRNAGCIAVTATSACVRWLQHAIPAVLHAHPSSDCT